MYGVTLWEVLGELPHLPRAGHVDNVDVNILAINRKQKHCQTPFCWKEKITTQKKLVVQQILQIDKSLTGTLMFKIKKNNYNDKTLSLEAELIKRSPPNSHAWVWHMAIPSVIYLRTNSNSEILIDTIQYLYPSTTAIPQI